MEPSYVVVVLHGRVPNIYGCFATEREAWAFVDRDLSADARAVATVRPLEGWVAPESPKLEPRRNGRAIGTIARAEDVI
jgi:hypothetical protein